MPPRKSTASVATNGGDADVSTISVAKSRDGNGVEEYNLPKSMVQRLAKGVLPSNTQIQKDALLAISKSATVFVNFIAATAGENAAANGKKTIMPNDVFAALKDQEFEAFLPKVQAEVTKYNDIQCSKRNTYRRTKKAEAQATNGESNGDAGSRADTAEANGGTEADDDRPAKKARRESGANAAADEAEVEDEDMADAEDGDGDGAEDSADEDDAPEEEEELDEDEAGGEDEDEDEEDDDGHEGLNGVRDEALDEPDSD